MKRSLLCIFIVNVLSFSFAHAKYTCSSYFVETVSANQQYNNIFENGKITILQDIPNLGSEKILLGDIDLKPQDEFVAVLANLNRLLHAPIPNNFLSTYNLDNIRHMAFKILEVGPEKTKIKFFFANSEESVYTVDSEKIKTLFVQPILNWQKTSVDIAKIKFDSSNGLYSLYRVSSEGSKEMIASVEFSPYRSELRIEISDTSLLFQKNQLNTVLLKKILLENPVVRKISGSLAAKNRDVFLKALAQELHGTLQVKTDPGPILDPLTQIQDLAPHFSPEQFEALVQTAFRQTPFYKTNQSLGFGQIGRISFKFKDRTEKDLILEVESLRDE